MRHWLKDDSFRSLVRNTSFLALSKGIAAIAAIATLAFAGRGLGLDGFGILILIVSYAQAANGLSKFQSWQLVVRYGGVALAQGDETTFKQAAGFSLGLDLVSGFVGMAAAIALLPLIGGWFGLRQDDVGMAILYCLLIPAMGASSPSGLLRILDRFDLISWQGTVTPISRAVLAGAAFVQGWSFAAYLAIWFVTALAGDLFLWFLAWRELKRRGLGKGIRPTLKPTGLVRAWPFAVQVNLTSSLMSAWNPLARLIVGALLGPASAALYRVAASLADSAQKPADLLAKVYYPEVVRMDLATKHPWRLMLRGTALAGAFGIAAALILIVAGKLLIDSLFGAEFLGVYPVLLVLIGVPLVLMIAFPLPPMLYALDRPDAPLKARVVGALVYFAIVAPLSLRFDLMGAAAAMVAGQVVMVMVMMLYLKREYRRVRAR